VLLDLPQARRLASRGLLCQAVVAALAAVAAAIWGRYVGLSVVGGASIMWLTTLYISRRARVLETSVTAALWRVLVGELIKVSCTIALFLIAARMPHLVWPALLLGYVAALIASWVAIAAPDAGLQQVALGARNQRWEA
jgi:F0F1-type ATP synthase assembly protein I